jgi:SAM-dependent methyltransferase
VSERRVDEGLLAWRDAHEATAPKAFGALPAKRRFPLRRARFPFLSDALAALAARLGRPPRVLDAGLGQAKLERLHLHAHPEAPVRFHGVDRHAYRLDLRRDVPGIARVQADLLALPYRDGAFDAAVCSYVLQHLASPEAAVAELARVVAPGGLVLLAVPNRPQPLKLLSELLHPLLVAVQRRVLRRRFDYGAQMQFWNLPRVRRLVEGAGLRPLRWQGFGFVTGGPLAWLEDVERWYRFNVWLGARVPRLAQDLVVIAER